MVKKGRMTLDIVIPEEKILSLKEKLIASLKSLKNEGEIESATWNLEEISVPESGSI